MAITYERVIQQIENRLGEILGATAAVADANYTASPTTSTVKGPAFIPSQVQDALAATLGEIVEAIASTPRHPERQRFADVTASLANLAAIPQVGSGGARIIGIPGFVRDAANSKALLPASLDRVRDYNQFPTIYSALDSYLYAYNGNRIEHTRANVVIEVCVYTRPSSFTGAIALDDWHEGGLVDGSVCKLAPKESLYTALYQAADKGYEAHKAKISSYGNPDLYGKAQAAPSST